MKIRKGDKVQILAGKDKGKTGPVSKVLSAKKLIVEGVNMANKHQRSRKQGEKGTVVKFAAPIEMSNVMVICPKCGKPTRIGFKTENKNKIRECKKCKATF